MTLKLVALADHLKANRSRIVDRWMRSVRNDDSIPSSHSLNREQLYNYLPALFSAVDEALRQDDFTADSCRFGKDLITHGETRWRQGYDLPQMIREMGVIHYEIAECLEEMRSAQESGNPEMLSEARFRINMVLMEAITDSVRTFAQLKESDEKSAWQRLEAVNRISRTLSQSLNLQDIFQIVTHEVRQLFAARLVTVSLLDDLRENVTETSVDVQQKDFVEEKRVYPLEGTLLETLRSHSEGLIVSDLSDPDSRRLRLNTVYENQDFGSMIAVPLLVTGEVIGVLSVFAREKNAFSEKDLTTLIPIAEHFAICICNANLYLRAITREEEAQNSSDKLARVIQDTHHRIKNNLQTIAALLDVQAMSQTDSNLQGILRDLILQVRTIAAVHGFLSRDSGERTLSLQALFERVLPMALSHTHLKVNFEVDEVPISTRLATPLALIVNELIDNAASHGADLVAIHAAQEGGECSLVVKDNGPGFPPHFDAMKQSKLGLVLVNTLMRQQLQGQVRYETDHGAKVSMSFPLESHSDEII